MKVLSLSNVIATITLLITITTGNAATLTLPSHLVDYGTFIRDTDTGIDWLKVNQTQGMSYNEVVASTYYLDGWHHATVYEVGSLLKSFAQDIFDEHNDAPTEVNSAHTPVLGNANGVIGELSFASYLGPTIVGRQYHIDGYHTNFADYVVGMTCSTSPSTPLDEFFYLYIYTEYDTRWVTFSREGISFQTDSDQNRASANSAIGHWLIRPVPIPSALWLLGTGLIGLVGFRKKFKKSWS